MESGIVNLVINEIFVFDGIDKWVEVVDIRYCWFKDIILEVGFLEYKGVQINIFVYNGILGIVI